MGQREEATVGWSGGWWGRRLAALVQKVGVEPEAAARRQQGGVAAVGQSRFLDNQLTVLQASIET